MLAFIIEAVEQIVVLMVVIGVMVAYVRQAFSPMPGRRIFLVGSIAGVAAAAVMSIMKNSTNKVSASYWNFRIFLLTLVAFLAFLVCSGLRKKKVREVPAAVSLAAVSFALLWYTLPDFLAYPFRVYVAETTIFSSSYVIKLGGVVLAFVLTLVLAFAAQRMSACFSRRAVFAELVVLLAINEVRQLGRLLNIMVTKRMIRNSHGVFVFIKFCNNHSNLFIYLTLGVLAVVAASLLARSFRVREPYSNPAQHRKIRAKWRDRRRWCLASAVCMVLVVLLMTVGDRIVHAETELSPTEDATIVGGDAVVTFGQVADGHLHRYGYTTPNGITVRFIVIKKPNSSTYGVGMDCCDICGQTGYYENGNGEVVCNRCDVVMNINTIGFKGGCNPKIFDYTVQDQKIIIPVEGLAQYEKDFK